MLGIAVIAFFSASHGGSLFTNRYLVCDDRSAVNDVRCVGPAEAKPAIDPDGMVWIAYANRRERIDELRAVLATKLSPGERDTHALFDKQGMRAGAAHALAHLGDTQSAQAIEDLVREFETDGYGFLWSDTLAALAVLDRDRASRYALDFLSRAGDWRMSLPGGSDKLQALDYIRETSATLDKVADAEANGYDHAYCKLMATRVRLEPKLHAKVRDMFAGHYSGTWLAGCDSDVMHEMNESADAAILVRHFGRDDAGLDFGMANTSFTRALESLALGTFDDKAKKVLRDGLATYATYPQIAHPDEDTEHLVALHAAATAGLGGDPAPLYAFVDATSDDGTAWLAAYWAIRLRLPGAADHAGALMVKGLAYRNEIRNGIYEDLRARVVDAFADVFPDDPRWAIAVLQTRETDAAEHALYRLVRHTPPNACATVTDAAVHADRDGREFGLLALTALGQTCLPELGALADRGELELRGLALEMLAALRAPDLCAHLDRATRDGVPSHPVAWARSLHGTRCDASSHGDQPVPPRVFKQGY